MIYLDWVMSLIVLCVYPIAALPVAALSQKLRRVAKQTQEELGGMTSLLTEKLSGARLIKSFRLENYAADRLNKSFEHVYKLRMKAVKNRARIDPLLEALGGIAIAGVIALAYWRIASGISTVGDFMGFITALLMASQPIRALGSLSGRINEGLAAAESFYDLIDEKPLIVDRPGAKPLAIATSAIRFEDVGFAYDRSGVQAISNFSLNVPGGHTVALVGRSGAGKSTVLNLVPRLFDVDTGRISIDGQDIRDVTLASLRDAISIVAQDVTLFDDTIAANIALGRLGAPQSAIVAAAEAAAAHDFIMAQPQGYATEIGDRGLRLSGGQRQRLALARAILKDAPILLLDEATSALDTESERLVQEALARFTKNRTTLVIAHRLSTVQNADLICVMDEGTHRRNRHPPAAARRRGPLRAPRALAGADRRARCADDSRGDPLLAAQHAVDDAVGPALRLEVALQLVGVVDRIHPLEERHRPHGVVGEVALEEVVEDAGVRLPDVPVLERQLLLRFLDRHALVQEAVEHAHQAGAVGARLAVHQHRIFDFVEQALGAQQLLARRRGARAHLEVDELHAEARASLALQTVAAALALAAQVDDGADAGLGEPPELMRGGLRRAPGLVGEPMAVGVDEAEDAVIDEQHVEVGGRGARWRGAARAARNARRARGGAAQRAARSVSPASPIRPSKSADFEGFGRGPQAGRI